MRILSLAVGALVLLGCGLTHTPLPVVDSGQPQTAKPSAAIPLVPSVASVLSTTAANTTAEPDTLTLAAECLERGDSANAAVHLETYVCRHPEQVMFRVQLAEMLTRLGHDATAKAHYERFIADAANATGPARNQLVTAHTRLMEIAQRADDRFAELFHRGVGLLLLAKEQEKLADSDPAFGEEMLCKAMKALVEAKELHPSDARVHVYLAEVYETQGNPHAAEAERAGARTSFVPAQMPTGEWRKCLLVGGIGR
jgi:predicted Zn-dependent protease